MAITYNWKIVTCEHEVATGGITVAHWECIAVDGDYTARVYSSCGFTPDPDDPSFTPYVDLTESEVLFWVWGTVDKTSIESKLHTKIESMKTPTYSKGTPW